MVSILLASIGITFIIIGILIFIDRMKILKNGNEVQGKIIDFEKVLLSHINDEKKIVYTTAYKPIIKFKTKNNEVKIITYDILDSDKKYKVGDNVILVYSENNCDYVEIVEKQIIFTILCKLIAIGIMFVVFSVVLWMV
ncbi:MAG: DUF3592 domain-containing protein [Clostridium sp.]